MSLPKYAVSSYETNLISDNKSIEYRPFLVKEEKLLLIALESNDKKQISKAICNVLQNCILTKNVSINDLPSFDVEYLFLKVREKSSGEIVKVSVVCPVSKKRFEIDLDLSEIKIEKKEDMKNIIEINENLGLVLKYPTFLLVQELVEIGDKTEKLFKIIIESVDKIYDKTTTYNPKDYTEKEMVEFIESLPQNSLKRMNEFYDNFPKIVYEKEVTSPFSGKTMKVRLNNFMDFFG